ncbi:MAG: efflux transporter outer membrane subunit [Alphaproteobacteria bacterium]|nr:efflux transporter outer membrane subunit [Alphaproteobacteria bacterium]
MKRISRVTVLAILALLAACAVGPDYKRPPVETPKAYKEAYGVWRQAKPQAAFGRGAWWKIYKDPILDGLERQVDLSNQNLKAADAAYRESDAAVGETRAALFPAVTLDSSVGRMQGTMPRPMQPDSLYGTASWVPDLWGRIRRNVESASAKVQASADDLASARLSMQAMLATNYFDLRAQDELRRLLNAEAEADRKNLQIVKHQYDTGTGDAADVLAAQMQLENIEAQAVNAGNRRARLEHAIAVLIGKPPTEFSLPPQKYVGYAPDIPPGLPSALLERRPDIAAAEREMAAANAQIGVATAAWFPDFTLSASAGYASMALGKFMQAADSFWAVWPSLAETVFDAGAREARIAQARAGYDRSVAMYRQTVLTAFQQVEDSLAAQHILMEQRKTQEASALHAHEAEQLAYRRYMNGVAPYNNVLTAKAVALKDDQKLLMVREARLDASIALIEALGGGWKAHN